MQISSAPSLTTASERRGAASTISLAAAMATLDASMTNTALPSIAQELAVLSADVIDVVTIYQFAMVALMLPLAALGNRISHRRVFIWGLALFVGASLWCGLSRSLWELEAARALQGLGAAAVMGTNLALVRLIYPAEQLGKGLGINALVIALSLAGGPVLASALLTFMSWQWIFLMNVPLGIVAAWWAFRKLPTGQLSATSYDVVGAMLCTATLGALVASLDALAHGSGSAWWLLLVSLICGYSLFKHERRRASPIFPLDLMCQPAFLLGTICIVCAFATQGAALVALPFLLQESMGKPIGEVGALIAPWPLMGAMMGPVAGALSDRLSPAALGSMGLACLSCGVLALGLLPATATIWQIAISAALCGLGFGLFLSPNQRALLARVPAQRSGSASGVIGLARLFGQTIGAMVVAWCLSRTHDQPEQLALFIAASLATMGCLIGVFLMIQSHRDR